MKKTPFSSHGSYSLLEDKNTQVVVTRVKYMRDSYNGLCKSGRKKIYWDFQGEEEFSEQRKGRGRECRQHVKGKAWWCEDIWLADGTMTVGVGCGLGAEVI